MQFIYESLLLYCNDVSDTEFVDKCLSQLPIILSGDFHVNFASKEAQPLIDSLDRKFNMKMNNDRNVSTTKLGNTIDAVFVRYLDKLQSNTFTSYFSYHKLFCQLSLFWNMILWKLRNT